MNAGSLPARIMATGKIQHVRRGATPRSNGGVYRSNAQLVASRNVRQVSGLA
jgi:hypothetical protein